ncbi:hypothetical protein EV647_0528 [Kribbella sp. VKM Ac-2566]|nr:hypothetical protein EV647_0528 [Kribbella sp. VKM Ac-2566]
MNTDSVMTDRVENMVLVQQAPATRGVVIRQSLVEAPCAGVIEARCAKAPMTADAHPATNMQARVTVCRGSEHVSPRTDDEVAIEHLSPRMSAGGTSMLLCGW